MAALPPAQPTAILRGHRGHIQATVFVRLQDDGDGRGPAMNADSRLATGDSDGYVVLWDLAIVRPRAVWRAHTRSILGLSGWDDAHQIVTHGRDNKLVVWQVGVADEPRLSRELPLDAGSPADKAKDADDHRPRPWMVHSIDVNTMNFCAFAWSPFPASPLSSASGAPSTPAATERLVAVSNALTLEAVSLPSLSPPPPSPTLSTTTDSQADLFHFPSQRRVSTAKLGTKEGMIMALALFYASPDTLMIVAAFENGAAVVASLSGSNASDAASAPAIILYRAQPHSQPVLSLDVAPDHSYFLTSSADAVIAKHPIPAPAPPAATPEASSQPLPPPAPSQSKSLLSAALANEWASSSPSALPVPSVPPASELLTEPLGVTNTKHAGQQGLRIRSDGRLFATAGWDTRVRVYAAGTMREVAVLKWHQAGCFAIAFAPVRGGGRPAGGEDSQEQSIAAESSEGASMAVTKPARTMVASRDISVKERRRQHSVTAHWLAAGSKDGKVSLWDLF